MEKSNKKNKQSLVFITANDLCVIFSLSFFKYTISQSRFLNIQKSEKINKKRKDFREEKSRKEIKQSKKIGKKMDYNNYKQYKAQTLNINKKIYFKLIFDSRIKYFERERERI